MPRPSGIVLLLSHSDSPSPALERARALALNGGQSLHLCLIEHAAAIEAVAHVSHDVARLAREGFLRQRSEWLEARAEALRKDGIDAHAQVIWGRPTDELVIDAVLDLQPVLLIKDIEPQSLPRRLLLTPLDWKLLRGCPVPLMLVGGQRPALPRTAVVAVDPVGEVHKAGRLNPRLLEAARAVPGIQAVHLAYAFEPVAALTIGEPLSSAVWLTEVSDNLRAHGQRALQAFGRAEGVDGSRCHLLAGAPELALPGLVDEVQADVLVLGTIQRHGLDRLIVGSTAERILQQANCDILAVKPAGFTERLLERRRQRLTGAPPALAAVTSAGEA